MNMRRKAFLAVLTVMASATVWAQSIGPATLPDGVGGVSYGQTLTYTPAITSVTWSITAGALPPGLTLGNGSPTVSLSTGNGVLTQGGTFTFTVTAVPIQGATAVRTYTIHVLDITTTSLAVGYQGQSYSQTLAAVGNVGALTWGLATGSLPAGLTLSPQGTISGALPANATGTGFTVRATDAGNGLIATKPLFISVAPPLVINGTPPSTTAGASYTFTFTGTGGFTDGPSYTWFMSPANLDGLTMSTVNNNGVLSGVSAAGGTFGFTITATDLSGQPTSRSAVLNVLAIATGPTLAPAVVGTPYSQSLIAVGNVGAVNWALSGAAGSISINFLSGQPTGLSLSTGGQITGTPLAAGTATFSVNATDPTANIGVTKSFNLTINPGLSITPTTLPNGTVNTPYSQTLTAPAGAAPLSWSLQTPTTLPAGLTLNAATGVISGTPTASGSSTFSILVKDANNLTGGATYTLVINAAVTPFTITTTTLPGATVGAPYTATLAATGGTTPYSNWLVVSPSSLPAGLSLNVGTGVISGRPTIAAITSFTVQVQDSSIPAKTATSTTLSLTVSPAGGPLSITTSTLPAGTVNSAYAGVTLSATGGTSPYSWNVSTGALPAGLSLNATTGALSGTPTASGSFPLTIQATDSAATPARTTANFTLIINSTVTPISVTIAPTGAQNPAQQPPTTVTLGSPASQAITGTLTLTFASAVGPDDPLVKFSNGNRTAPFTIPAGSTQGSFGSSGISVLTGTTAGTITITAALAGADGTNLTPTPIPTTTMVIAKAVPVITKLTFNTNAGGGTFTVSATGFSTTREVKTAIYHFQAASGTTLAQPDVTVDVSSAFTGWYNSAASTPFGTQFTVTVPFTFSGPLPISTLTMDLTNSMGTSAHASPN